MLNNSDRNLRIRSKVVKENNEIFYGRGAFERHVQENGHVKREFKREYVGDLDFWDNQIQEKSINFKTFYQDVCDKGQLAIIHFWELTPGISRPLWNEFPFFERPCFFSRWCEFYMVGEYSTLKNFDPTGLTDFMKNNVVVATIREGANNEALVTTRKLSDTSLMGYWRKYLKNYLKAPYRAVQARYLTELDPKDNYSFDRLTDNFEDEKRWMWSNGFKNYAKKGDPVYIKSSYYSAK